MTETLPALARSARRLRLVTLAATAAIEAVILLAAWAVFTGRRADLPALHIQDGGLAPPWAVVTLLLIGLLVGLALLRLARLLGRVASGERFGVAADLRGFAFWLFLTVLASILAPFLAMLSSDGATVSLSLGFGEALMLLVTGLLFLVARLLDEARRLADDHSQIV